MTLPFASVPKSARCHSARLFEKIPTCWPGPDPELGEAGGDLGDRAAVVGPGHRLPRRRRPGAAARADRGCGARCCGTRRRSCRPRCEPIFAFVHRRSHSFARATRRRGCGVGGIRRGSATGALRTGSTVGLGRTADPGRSHRGGGAATRRPTPSRMQPEHRERPTGSAPRPGSSCGRSSERCSPLVCDDGTVCVYV